jgi:glycosyltransferase involved in cell wall biosynthesis
MDLLIDVQALQSPATRTRGIGRYTRNLVAALAAARPGWRIELVWSGHLEPIDPDRLQALPAYPFCPPLSATPTHAEVNERYYADWLAARNPEALLIPSFFDDHTLVPHFTGPRPPLFAVLYDLIPLLFPDAYLRESQAVDHYAGRFRRLLRADGVLADSEAAANDLRTMADQQPPPLVVIGGAPDAAFVPVPGAELARQRLRLVQKLGLTGEFILYVGGFDFRKNLAGAMEAYAGLSEIERRGLDLVIACQLTSRQRLELMDMGQRLGIADSLKLTGYVSDDELRALYQLCRVFFFPSLYEGLGLPVLEALRCGAPVVASDRSSIPECAGDVSWLFDPGEPAEAVAALRAALAEPRAKRHAQRIAHADRFCWDKSTEQAARFLETFPGYQSHTQPRRRLAWVSPFPPTPSGISDYSAELLGPLAESYEIELVLDPRDPVIAPELADNHMVVLANELSARHDARPFDVVICHLGNSHYHTYMVDLLRRFRALVVLHDFYLGGMVFPAILDGDWPASLAEELDVDGEKELAAALRRRVLTEGDILERAPLSRRLLGAAGAVVVHSTWTWQRVRKLVDVPVIRIPQAVPVPALTAPAALRERLALDPNAFIVATLGLVGRAKRISSLLTAMAGLPESVRRMTQLLIVGPAPDELQEEYLALAGELGIGRLVRFLGKVALEDLGAYARAADVCVQLRFPTRGETSAALLRALAAGAACITSDHGSIAELPPDVAVKVRTPQHEVEDVKAALMNLHDKPALRAALGEAAVRHVQEHHHHRQVVKQYGALIELLAAQRHKQDTLWCEHACAALASAGSSADGEVIDTWADLRARGQAKLSGRDISGALCGQEFGIK